MTENKLESWRDSVRPHLVDWRAGDECADHPYFVCVTTDRETKQDIAQCGFCGHWVAIGGEPFTDELNHPPRRGLWRRLLDWVAK